jgi:signal transduction histidine kinase
MEHPSTELLTGRAYPEAAAALRVAIDTIIRRWEQIVRQSLPSADQLTLTQVRDDMPKVLEQVAKALESDAPYATRKLAQVTPLHGETRFHQNFRLEELMTEHSILRPILLDEVTHRLDRPMNVGEVSALMAALDLVTQQAHLEFVDHQTRQLTAANEAQSKYLSFLSHDLRGNLNGVCLMIEVLKRELASEARFKESVDDLDMMRRSIFDTIATMDRFLHAERFRKGKVQVRPSRVNLRYLLMDIVAQFTYLAKDKGVELKVDAPDAGECAIQSDKDLLSMILQNVTSNAIKYGPRAPVTLSLRSLDGGAWRIAVADHGPGIARDKLATLFAPYARGETQGQPGVGLGLNIARQAADLLGAKLWAESDGTNGTTFHVEVTPIAPAAD